MIYTNDIPHLTLYRQRTNLPIDQKLKTMNSLVLMNSKTLNGSIATIKHPLLYSNSKYLNYYIEPFYRMVVNKKIIRKNYKKEQKLIYGSQIKDETNLHTVMQFSMLKNKNVYYDMNVFNNIYFSNTTKLAYERKIYGYIDLLKYIINQDQFKSYKNIIMTINVNDWVKDVKSTMRGTPTFDNPITILLIAMKKYFEKFSELGNIDIIFFDDKKILLLNPSKCTTKTYPLFARMMSKFIPSMKDVLEDEEKMEKEVEKIKLKEEIPNDVKDNYKFTGDDSEDEEFSDEEIVKIIDGENEEVEEKEDELVEFGDDVDTVELARSVYEINKEKVHGRSTASIKRDTELREKQKQLKIKNMTIDDYKQKNARLVKIPTTDISSKITSTNKHVQNVKFTNFEKVYNEELSTKDLVSMVENLNNMDIPVYIRSSKVEDTSDELTLKETWTFELEDVNRVRHTLKFDVPKFVDDKFLYINGNKKTIVKQLTMKPIVKTGPDEVQICSNYNKIFITRYGTKISPKIEKMRKFLISHPKGYSIISGDSSELNKDYKTIIEYDELGKNFYTITTKDYTLIFDQTEVERHLGSFKPTDDDLVIGFYKDKSPIIMKHSTGLIENKYDIYDFIYSYLDDKTKETFDDLTPGSKRFVFSRATIMSKKIPIILLCGYCEGITTTLKKANVKHYFTDKRPKVSLNEEVVQFADGYLVYDRYPFENSLLLDALATIPTKSFNYSDFDDKDVYLDLFQSLYGARNLANAFDTFYYSMIDPITKEILEDLDYPTDFVGVILFANQLLADNSYIIENNMNLYRVRSNEVINAMIHKEIADAYGRYRSTASNKNPVKISIPRDAIIKKLLASNSIEDYSTINPIAELEKTRSISPKGFSGMNLEDAYTQDKRSYDETMKGLLAMSTSPDKNVGMIRAMTLEPNVTNPRGFIDINAGEDDVNLLSPSELLTPLTTRDDTSRTAMSTKQSKHMIPVANASPTLISNGVEQVVQYNLSKDFIIRAEDDGVIADVDEETGLIIAKYKNGNSQAIQTKPRVVKNGAGGFYLSLQLQCDLKKGDKFKKDDILAYENKFFTNDGFNGNRFNIGSLQKVAIMSAYSTFEDSSMITKKMAEDMGSEIIMQEDTIIGKNATIGQIVKIGDYVNIGDILVSYETSYDEEGMNKFLSSVGDDLKEEIKSLNKVPMKAKHAGEIVDIKIYSSVELGELSPSLKTVVSKYYSNINKKKKMLEKYDKSNSIIKAGILFNEATGRIVPTADGKIKGRDVFDGVLIEFYIKYHDVLAVGDKITFQGPLKSIIGEVVDEGYEPYSEYRPDEEISTFLGPSSILQRMVPSVLIAMFANKVLIELKRQLEDIYNE